MMVNTSLSAKQEKENRFQQIKKEVADMVRVRVLTLDSRVCFPYLSLSLSLCILMYTSLLEN